MARQSKVDRAYHSPHMKTVGSRYYQLIKDCIHAKTPGDEVQFFSSVLGNKVDLPIDAQYWQMNLESPVRFYTALTRMIQARKGQTDLFLEVGPQAALAYPVRQTLSEAGLQAPYIASLAWKQDSFEAALSAIGNLYANYVPIDFGPLFPGDLELLTEFSVN
jgi:acyl transferase domain-containing protein